MNNVEPLVYTKSNANNYYLYHINANSFSLCHPYLLSNLFLIDSMVKWKDPIFEKRKLESYYRDKSEFLKINGFLPSEKRKVDFKRITTKSVEQSYSFSDNIILEVTEKCNLNCEYCTFGDIYDNYDSRINRNMDIDTGITFVEHVISYWKKHPSKNHKKDLRISFIGGEPLLNMPFIKKFVGYFQKQDFSHINFIYKIITNGILIQKNIDFLIKNGIFLQISIDGDLNENIHRRYPNGKPAGNDIINSINFLQQNYKSYFSTNISFNTVVHNKNTKESASSFIFNTYQKYPTLSEITLDGITNEKDNYLVNNNYNIEFYKKDGFKNTPRFGKFNLLKNSIQETFYNCVDDIVFNPSGLHPKKRIPSKTCMPFSLKVYVTAKGKILPCEVVGHQYEIGFVKDSIVEVNFEHIAKLYNNYFDSVEKQCQNCYKSNYCQQCLFLVKNFDENRVCIDFKNRKTIIKDLSVYMDILEANPSLYKSL